MSVAAYEGDGGHRDHGAGGLGGAGAVLLLTAYRDVSRVHADKPVFRVSKVYVCRSRYVDDYTVVIYRRLGLNSPDMTHDTQEEL